MINEINTTVDRILDMNPDPIPRFVLLKEFKNVTLNDPRITDLSEQVCNHLNIRNYETVQYEHDIKNIPPLRSKLLRACSESRNTPSAPAFCRQI